MLVPKQLRKANAMAAVKQLGQAAEQARLVVSRSLGQAPIAGLFTRTTRFMNNPTTGLRDSFVLCN